MYREFLSIPNSRRFSKEYLNNCTIESAGTNPETVNPIAIEVMREIDIDLLLYGKYVAYLL